MIDKKQQLDSETKQTIQATVKFLAEHGVEITRRFYTRLFYTHPELKNLFNLSKQENGEQQQALARSVYAFAKYVDELDVLQGQLARIAHKHVSLNIQPNQYPIVGENLLWAIHQVVSEKLDSDTADMISVAWGKAYQILANMLIEAEGNMYREADQQYGGWKGLREFALLKREDESQDVTSFYLTPSDDLPLPQYSPGQYLSLYLQPNGSDYRQVRQYSLSDSFRDDCYRITVKREGLVSRHLHDHWKVGDIVQVSPPSGDFQLKTNSDKPIVLMSAGVGVTPMISLLNTALETSDEQNITFVHAVRNSEYHPFKKFIKQTSEEHERRLQSVFFYEEPLASDEQGKDYHHQGLINLESIQEVIKQDQTDYYLCGPIPFMSAVHKGLTAKGIATHNIHYEVFGADKDLY